MRTTIEINDELMRQAKRLATDENIPLRQVVDRALRQLIGSRRVSRKKFKLRWSIESGRLQPGVRIEDRDALFDVMDGRS